MEKTTTEMQLVTIEKLVPYVNNARTHNPQQILKLRSSLREFGFIKPIIIDREYNVIAGHGGKHKRSTLRICGLSYSGSKESLYFGGQPYGHGCRMG